MARPPRKNIETLSPGQAQYVLERLIKERRVPSSDISRYVTEMGQEISQLEQRLQRLRDAAGPAAAAAAVGIAAGAAAMATVRRGRKRGRPGRPPGRPPASAAAGDKGATAGKRAKRGRKSRSSITPEQLASRQLQGRYLALVRRFPATRRAYYAKVARAKGREAAIREMQDAVKK